jgi:hypothetical protein
MEIIKTEGNGMIKNEHKVFKDLTTTAPWTWIEIQKASTAAIPFTASGLIV